MKLRLEQGSYVLAVSGGVDSVVLLDLLKDLKPVVAHFDHGIREDSGEDAKLVESLAKRHGLVFELGRAQLGKGASEAAARQARYDFLFSVCEKHKAKLITAHHQDDLIETAIINMIRGTGPFGLVNMLSNTEIIRPFLSVPKAEIEAYARSHRLDWRDDPTNADESYLRNYVRHRIVPKIEPARKEFVALVSETAELTRQLQETLGGLTGWLFDDEGLVRERFVQLDFATACYVVRDWLFRAGVNNITTDAVKRSVVAAKTLQAGKQIDLDGQHVLKSHKRLLQIDHPRHV